MYSVVSQFVCKVTRADELNFPALTLKSTNLCKKSKLCSVLLIFHYEAYHLLEVKY